MYIVVLLVLMVGFEDFLRQTNKSGIATDFDGTISAITEKRAQAKIEPTAKQRLAKLADYYPLVAIISGRPVKTIADLSGLDKVFYIGNHGAEYLYHGHLYVNPEAKKFEPILKKIYSELKNDHLRDYEFDYKTYSVAIHYRNQPDPKKARAEIEETIKSYLQPGLKVQHGRMVYDISIEKINKGMAISYLVDKFDLSNFFYAGDDRTDVDAFKAMKKLSDQGINTISAALLSSEAPAELAEAADIDLSSIEQLNNIFSKLLPS